MAERQVMRTPSREVQRLFSQGLKRCPRCRKEQPLDAFSRNARHLTGRRAHCKACDHQYVVRRRKTVRDSNLKNLYALSLAEYEQQLKAQGGRCAICQEAPNGRSLDVDHNHHTGQIRGLLCSPCNLLVGRLEADPRRCQAAMAYTLQTNNASALSACRGPWLPFPPAP